MIIRIQATDCLMNIKINKLNILIKMNITKFLMQNTLKHFILCLSFVSTSQIKNSFKRYRVLWRVKIFRSFLTFCLIPTFNYLNIQNLFC